LENDSRERKGESTKEETATQEFEDSGAVEGEERRDAAASESHGVYRKSWLVLSCLLFIAAAILLLLSRTDAAFVAAALGVSAWFWNLRVKLKRQYGIRKPNRER
jgi:Flp pilus assembly protein TadB